MKFLLDAHLPQSLKAVLEASGHDVLHTLDLPERNATRDGILNEISLSEHRVLITKDTDFYYSHLLLQRPWKLVLLRTGNMSLKSTKLMFEQILPEIVRSLDGQSMLEIDRVFLSKVLPAD